jgi:mannan polymerase II complex MNN10 subunit
LNRKKIRAERRRPPLHSTALTAEAEATASRRLPAMAERPLPRRSADHRHGLRLRLRRLLLLLPLALLLALLSQLPALLLRRANSLGRRCLPGAPDRLVRDPRLSLAIVTLADDGAGGSRGPRSFRGVLAASARNKRAYAAARGYRLVALPASAVDPGRPPSWSKVLALRAHLRRHHWLFWNDAVGRRCCLIYRRIES